MIATVAEVCTDATRLTGYTTQPGRTLATEELSEAARYLNRMLDSWNTMRNLLHLVKIYDYTFTPSQEVYTIGPSTADFPTTTRPDFIEAVNLILTSGGTPYSSIPLYIMTAQEYESLVVPKLAVSIPSRVYIDGSYPNRNVYFWGYPTETNDVRFFIPDSLSNSYATGDAISVPSGYMKSFVYNLAVELSAAFPPNQDVNWASVVQQAQEARAAIASLNVEVPLMVNDAFGVGRRGQTGGPAVPYYGWPYWW